MIEQVLITTTADNTQAEEQYKGLRVEIKDLKKELDKLEEGTAEYDATFSKLSAKMKIQQDRTKALRTSSADLGDVLGNSTKVLGTVSQSFAGVTSAMSLFGIENEALLKNISRIQAFEAIARTFTSLEDTLTKTLPALKNNIMGFFKDTNKLKLDLQVDAGVTTPQGVTQQAVAVDTEGLEKAAKATERSATAANSSAASSGILVTNTNATAVANAEITKEKYNQLAADKTAEINKQKGLLLLQEELLLEKQIAQVELDSLTADLGDRTGKKDFSKATPEEIGEFLDSFKGDSGIKKGESPISKLNAADLGLDEIQKEYDKIGENIKSLTAEQEKYTQAAQKTTKAANGLGNAFKGIGIGLAIGAAITLITIGVQKLIELYKKQQERLKDALQLRKDISDEVSKNLAKEEATLAVLSVGYQKVRGNQKEANKYLKDNEKQYKSVGIEIDKIIKGEVTYSEAIRKSNELLYQRALNLAYFNQLTKEYEKKISAQTNVDLLVEEIAKGTMEYDKVSKEIMAGYETIAKADKNIDELKRKITELPKELPGKDGGDKAVTVLKTYSELLADINALYQGINLNNPFTPERLRQAEESFNKVKLAAEESVKAITQNETLSSEERLYKIAETNQLVVNAEKQLIQVRRQIQLDNAKWERDNQLRIAKEQKAIQKNTYKETIEAAQASLKAGVIKIEQFNEIFKSVQNAAGTSFNSVKEFFDYLGGNEIINRNDTFTSGIDTILKGFTSIDNGVENIDIEGVKNKIKEQFNANIDVETPLEIDLGNLSIDEFNYLQQLLGYYDAYNKNKQDIIIQSNEETKKNTEDGYNIQLDLLDKLLADSERKLNDNNSKLRKGINERTALGFKEGLLGIRSGYLNIQDEINVLQNEIANEDNIQSSIKNKIDLLNKELDEEQLTLERRTEINEQLKQLESDLTASEETESEKRLAIKEKERDVRQQILDGSIQAAEDVTTILSNIYDASETSELNNLKRLLNAKTITQEQYEEKSEALSKEYAIKRQRIQVFTGLLNATASSIGAFQSAMNSGIPYPYNLIAAGVSSAAALSSVLLQVATLKSLSIGDTSVTPTNTTAGGGLNYQLQEQQVSNERLLNSLTSQKVYVVESEINSVAARRTQVEEMSTF